MRNLVRLDAPRPDGATLRDHMRTAEAATGRRLIEEPDIPAAACHVWIWFRDLHAGRAYQGGEPIPFSYREMDAWARLCGIRPTPWEIETLRAMDAALCDAAGACLRNSRNAPARRVGEP